ncbi:hypothetical protein STCU_00582 [Strigomonas culicis]|nr:hypothetical protein STCU_00582 [Strigomonas culicis]|eukprot:EPY36438.1 hypothetical protein STCU_00582 [Strigomonas culicis]
MMLIGILFLDLVPLQEPMTCANYTDHDACPETYFAMTYQDAREKFLAAAAQANAEVDHALVLTVGNVQYYMDTAFIRGSRREHLLVHASGTHGVEGFTGSAIQNKILRDWNATSGPSVLFVHGINPYGMAHNRRANENNVDLNRNYLTAAEWQEVLQRDPNSTEYSALQHFFTPQKAPRFIDRYLFFVTAVPQLVKHGYAALKRALVTGQYHHAEGVSYGGDKEQRSIALLREILTRHSSGVSKAVFVDVHTGLGKYGKDTIMTSSAEEAAWAAEIFNHTTVQDHNTATAGPSSGYSLAKGIIRPCGDITETCLAVTEEFGTVNPLFVARATVLENQAYHTCRGSYVHAVMGTWFRDAFYPQELSYKQAVLKGGRDTFHRAFQYLSS